jgi:anti-anti-sigma factor
MTIREHSRPAVSVVRVEGSLVAPVKREVGQPVEALLADGRRSIVVDLAGVTAVDAAGVGELVQAYTLAAAGNAELWIENATGRVRTLLELAGLLEILTADADLTFEKCSRGEAADVGLYDRPTRAPSATARVGPKLAPGLSAANE